MGIPENLELTGKIYIKYIDNYDSPAKGDLLLVLNDDAIAHYTITPTSNNFNGYIKGQIFDGYKWQNMDIGEFCLLKENKLIKKQRVLDSFLLCKEIMNQFKGVILYKKYRGHFTREEYLQGEYNRGTRYDKPKMK